MKTKRKAYLATIILTILTIVFAIGIVVNAGNSEDYSVEIINDGKENRNGNSNAEITKKIIREEEDSSLLYEVSMTNKLSSSDIKEVTLLIDTSRSMDINDPESTIKNKAKEFVEQLFDEVPGIQISIVDNTGIKTTRNTNKNSVISVIDALANAYGNSIDETLEITKQTFTNYNNDKLLITFTDATDTMKKVQELQNEEIEAITILTNMTRSSYEVEGVSTIGETYMIDAVTVEQIIDSLNKSLKNIEVRDIFSDKILKYFDFSLVDEENTSIEATSDGYIWRIDKIHGSTTSTIQFKLKLKENVTVDENDTYKEIQTSSNMNVSYDKSNIREQFDVADSPIIELCKKYSVTIKAVNEEYKSLAVDGIDVRVRVQKEDGTVVFDDTLTTDSEGNVVINNLKTLGSLRFTLDATVNKIGYIPTTNNMTFEVYNDLRGRFISIPTSGIESNIDNDKRKVEVLFPIQTQAFNLEVNLADKDNSTLKIGDVEFRLIQPTINSKDELKAIYGTTNINGQVIFTPTIMPEDGTYDYILSQITEATNYETMGNVTLQITFKDGKVTKIEKKHNENVTAERIRDDYGIVNVYNINKGNNIFDFELELSDEINKNNKLEGAIYDIEVSANGENPITFTNQVTNSEGRINLQIPGRGYIKIKVKEVRPKVGYYKDTVEKEFIIHREDGKIGILGSLPPEIYTDITTLSSENKVKLNLYSKMSAEQSMIQVQVVDIQEDDIPLNGVNVKLIGTMTNEEYAGTVGEDGIVKFLIQPQEAGDYQYKIEIDNNTLPNGYSAITDDIIVVVKFDGERHVIDGWDIQGPICDNIPIEDDTGEYVYKGMLFKVGVDINETDASNFQVNLSNSVNGVPINGAKYDITIDNGTTVRKISGRATDFNGKIQTRLMLSDRVTITVKQTKSVPGYRIDDVEQEIILKKENGKFEIESQEPYKYADYKNGAIVQGNTINYYHTNSPKGNDNVLLNLYINKIDEQHNLLSGVKCRVYSDTLQNANGELLNEQVFTDDYGYFELEKIKVTNIKIPQDSEHILYIVETDKDGNDIENTLVKLKLTFRYNENKQYVALTNAEATWGNRLIEQGSKRFDGYETETAYESNLYLNLYGNYEDIGNFSLDLRKVNEDGQVLEGAKYDVTLTRPDGSKVIRRDLKITDAVEFSGILVTEGTTIEITEFEAPVGYKVNERTELIRVETVSENGAVTLDLQGTSDKLVVNDTQTTPINENTVKTNVIIDLIDDSLNTFKFGITTKDKGTSNGIEGLGYRIYSNKGAQIETELTNSKGNVSTTIGGNYAGQTVSYTISEIKTPKYYKTLTNPIKVNVVFAEDGTVDSLATLAAQTDQNYGTIWKILKTNTEDGNHIDIEIINETQEELNVKLHTIDTVTGNEFTNVTYKITPSLNLTATGTTDIRVGYVVPNSIEQYYISQLEELEHYMTIKNESFSLTYDENGDIAIDPNNLSENLEFVSRNGKTIELRVYIKPQFLIHIQNEYSLNPNVKLSGALYKVESDIGTVDEEVLAGNNGIGTAKLGGTLKNGRVIYTIKELRPAPLYQSIANDVKVEVVFDENGYADTVRVIQGNEYADASKIAVISNPLQNFEINVSIRNCKMVKFNITAVDSQDETYALRGLRFNGKSTLRGEELFTTTMQTDVNGQGTLGFDKDYANETITYTITETEKLPGYQFPAEELVIELTLDSNGKIIPNTVRIVQGAANAEILSIDPETFDINIKIVNSETEEFGVNILAVDKYDPSIKIENINYEAFLTTADYQKDEGYVGTGTTDVNGETFIQFGKYISSNPNGEETRHVRIVESNLNENYRKIRGEIVVDVTFDANGIVKNVSVPGGHSDTIGYLADGRFISVEPRRHTISVTIKHYPYLFMNVKAVDMYTQDELPGNFTISSYQLGIPQLDWENKIDIDYIGSDPYGERFSQTYSTTDDGEWAKIGIAPTGTNATKESWRRYYIYENQEPTSPMQYQKYRKKLIATSPDRLIGQILVNYNDKGRIESYVLEREISNNNIGNSFIEVEIIDGINLGIKIKYAPATVMQVTTKDAVSKEELSNVRIYSYVNHESYEYRTYSYNTTNTEGTTSWAYHGANINRAQDEYHMNTSLTQSEWGNSGWKGYFESGLVKIHVAYDDYGRIAAADVLSTDENGAPNAEIAGFEDNIVKVNILYNRKFNIKINKQDEYDENIKLSATFNAQSDQGANVDINSKTVSTLGMIWPGKKVRYNLSEKIVPQNYFPIKNVEFYVTFNDDGTISKVESDSDIFTKLYTRETVDKVRPTMVEDLEVAIKNEPQFIVKLNVMDNYYREKKLEGVTYSITSEPDSATGNPTTNNLGQISVPVGKAYKNETKVYIIEQTSTPNGYYPNNEVVKLEVKFNELGKIKDYRIIQGKEVVEIDAEKFKNERYVELDLIGNKPKDLQLGIVNIDKLTKQPISGDTYHVKAEEIKGGTAIREKDFIINDDGNVIDKINEFKETPGQEREVLYTISQITKTNTYRKIQDIVIKITFNEDGSIKYRNIISNPSNVNISIALGGRLQYLGANPLHMLLTIENDNAYDLIVKDEDKNYRDLGIPGTKYDITVNGQKLDLTTNEEGLVESLSRTEAGLITIQIAEKEAGIGYKSNIDNNTIIQVQKGEIDYSLELVSNSNPNYADVVIDSDYGTIKVIFKNETKSSITLVKSVADVRYRITEKQKNNEQLTTIREIGTDINDQIAKEELYYELGATPQNKIRVYTFKEEVIPPGYETIGEFNVTVEYDIYGKIKSITDDSNRVNVIEKEEGSNDIVVIVSEASSGYTVTIASQEVDSNLRINGSEFKINMTEGAGNVIADKQELTKNAGKNGYILEKGVIKIENIINHGEININIDQINPAEGYKFGTQVTSGTVKLNVGYNEGNPTFDIIENAGFEIYKDEMNHEIIIKVNNEPEAQMYINNVLKTKDENDNTIMTNIEGSKFEITSQIQTKTDITDTDLNVTTAETNVEGNTTAKVGIPYIGKTVLYKIHQIERPEYETIDDIIVQVVYDTKGLIRHYEVISNPDDAIVIGDKDTRNIKLQIINTKANNKYGYKIILEKHHANNAEYEEFIPGARFKIEVEQEYGDYYTSWEAVTDQDGIITSSLFNGYGNIHIKATEIDAPEGFEVLEQSLETIVTRNKNTGKLIQITANTNFEFSEDNSIIYIKPVNEPKKELYTIILNKTDKKTGKMITRSSAKFDVTMIGEENVGTEEEPQIEEVETYLGEFSTNYNGRAKLENLIKPKKAGVYKYIITEKQAPEGYLPLEEPVELQVKFVEDDQGNIVMSSIDDMQIVSGDASIKNKVYDLLNITINNFNEKDLNKYALDITKVDAKTGEAIEDMAIFKVKLPDENDTSVYTETMENDYGKGKLDYCYIEQDKDYNTRLTRMQIPTEPGVHKYVFKEVTPPEGYVKLEEDLELTIDFRKDEITKKIYIHDITSSNEKFMRIKTLTPCSTDSVIKVDILNNEILYTVEYRANDNDEGTNNLPGTQDKGEDIPINLDTRVPEREGYEFLGWATDKEATEPEYRPGDIYDQNASLVLYAVWEKVAFTITYDDNLEDEEIKVPEAQTKQKGIDLELSRDIPEKEGYEFLGWATDKEATEPEYRPGDIYIQNADAVLYAVWEKATFTITYDDNLEDEEVDVPEAQTKQKGTDLELSSEIPQREGYEFLGWATDKESTEAEYQAGGNFTIDVDTTLYAIWTRAEFTVTYDDNLEDEEIEVPEPQTKRKGTDLKLSSDIPQRRGYEFLGWATDKAATEAEYQAGNNFTIDADTTLFAIWRLKLYTITYDDNVDGVEIQVPDAQQKRHDESINLSEMVLNDRMENGVKKLFDGWRALDKEGNQLYDTEGNEIVYQPGDIYEENTDVILSAIWEDEIYLRSDEYQIINVEVDTSNRRKDKVIYDTEKIHEYNEGDKFIIGIRPQYNKTRPGKEPTEDNKGTTLDTLISNLNTNADKINVTKKTWDSAGTSIVDKEITQDDLVGTNMTIKLTKGRKQSIQLTLSVIGDVINDPQTTIVSEEGSIIYYSGDGIITAADVSTAATMCPTGKFSNSQNNLLLSGMGFVLSLDVLHNNMSTAWRSNIDEVYKTGTSTNIMKYIKEKGNW